MKWNEKDQHAIRQSKQSEHSSGQIGQKVALLGQWFVQSGTKGVQLGQ